METIPILSIVTPTRGNFSPYWLEQLLRVEGSVQFVLIYPPQTAPRSINDPRIKTLVSPYKGEVVQRFTGLINATGKYVLALDDDDFVHPQVVSLVTDYFQTFPDSWVLRLMMKKVDYTDQENIYKPWSQLPIIDKHTIANPQLTNSPEQTLRTLPIAPLTNRFNFKQMFLPYQDRKDMHGAHIENFNNKVWKNDLVQQALTDLSQTMKLIGALTWMPFWSLDRLLGLYIQALFFQENSTVGHWMSAPEQIRYIVKSQESKQEFRLILPADILLIKRFSQYGYFWNLGWEQFWVAVRKIASYYKQMVQIKLTMAKSE